MIWIIRGIIIYIRSVRYTSNLNPRIEEHDFLNIEFVFIICQINAQTELALRYNDISPLENHHCSVAFRILEDPECNIFRNLSCETYKKIREGMIRCILATDMARHNDIVNQFKEITPYFDKNNKAHVNLVSRKLTK